MKRCCLALTILMFAAACGEHSKDRQPVKYVYFDVTISGQSESLIPEKAVVNSNNLWKRDYQRPLVNGHAQFFADATQDTRDFRLDFSDLKVKSSLLSSIIYDWKPLPTVQVNGCKLGYADLVTTVSADNKVEYRLQGRADQGVITGNDCAGKLVGDMIFSLQGISKKNNVLCKAEDLPNSFIAALNTNQVGVASSKPRKRQYLCNVVLEDSSSMVTSPSMVSQYGYDFSIQAYHVTDFDIAVWGNFVGYLVYIDENGNASPVLPHNPEPLPLMPFTSVTLEVRGYGGLQNPLEVSCDFGVPIQPVDMLPVYAMGTTIVISQSVVFVNVATDQQYACNFKDKVTGQWIYFPPPSTASENYVFIANGIQVLEPSLNNLRITLDGAGQIVVTHHTVTFTAIPPVAINPEVNLILGTTGVYSSFPMQFQGGVWMTSLSLPYGVYEANIEYSSGSYGWLNAATEYGAFHVADISYNVTLPGLRLDQDQNVVIYTSDVVWPPPKFVISHEKNYLFRIGPTGLYGQSATTVTIGIIIGP